MNTKLRVLGTLFGAAIIVGACGGGGAATQSPVAVRRASLP